MALKQKFVLSWRALWKKPWVKRLFYNVLAISQRKSGDSMLNCGYAGEDETGFPEAWVENQNERSGCVLYWKILKPYLKDGDSVLEIGCGRGGGLKFVSDWKRLKRVVGVDFAGALIERCKRKFADSGIEFKRADALSLPLETAAFDVVVCVEASHGIEDKDRFLKEALRVLKRGGVFVWVDFFYARATAMHSLSNCERAVERSGATCIEKVDMTTPALASLDASSDQRERTIDESVWKPFRRIAKDFAVTKESSLYRCLCEKRGSYQAFVLKKE